MPKKTREALYKQLDALTTDMSFEVLKKQLLKSHDDICFEHFNLKRKWEIRLLEHWLTKLNQLVINQLDGFKHFELAWDNVEELEPVARLDFFHPDLFDYALCSTITHALDRINYLKFHELQTKIDLLEELGKTLLSTYCTSPNNKTLDQAGIILSRTRQMSALNHARFRRELEYLIFDEPNTLAIRQKKFHRMICWQLDYTSCYMTKDFFSEIQLRVNGQSLTHGIYQIKDNDDMLHDTLKQLGKKNKLLPTNSYFFNTTPLEITRTIEKTSLAQSPS